MDWLLKFLGLYCDPDEALPVPVDNRKQQEGTVLADNVTFDSKGRPFQTEYKADGFVSKEVVIGRTSSRTKGDDWILSLSPPKGKPKLNPNKYFRLKVFWAKEVSAELAAQSLSKEKGYGIRTLEYYWASFSKSQQFDVKNKVAPLSA